MNTVWFTVAMSLLSPVFVILIPIFAFCFLFSPSSVWMIEEFIFTKLHPTSHTRLFRHFSLRKWDSHYKLHPPLAALSVFLRVYLFFDRARNPVTWIVFTSTVQILMSLSGLSLTLYQYGTSEARAWTRVQGLCLIGYSLFHVITLNSYWNTLSLSLLLLAGFGERLFVLWCAPQSITTYSLQFKYSTLLHLPFALYLHMRHFF